MGIKSTQYVTRQDAITRILEIDALLSQKRYRDLDNATGEHDYSVENFVNETAPLGITLGEIENWSDTMIEDELDEPFYRWSMFDNYYIREDDDAY